MEARHGLEFVRRRLDPTCRAIILPANAGLRRTPNASLRMCAHDDARPGCILMIEQTQSASARRLHRLLAALPIRRGRPSTCDALGGHNARDQESPRLPSFRRDPDPAASTELLTCIAELEQMSADLKRIVMRTGGGVGSSLREHHYELEAVVHRLARSARL